MRIPLTVSGLYMLACLSSVHGEVRSDFHQSKGVDTIAFGSCYNPRDKKDLMFDAVLWKRPDVFIFLGNNIYGDTRDMEVLKNKYDSDALV